MQIALVAVVLLAGMWFTVLKPKSADSSSSAPVAQTNSQPVAPGVRGLVTAVDKAKAAAATSDAANAKLQAATGGSTATASSAAPAATKTATASSSAPATTATATPKHTAVAKKPVTATRKPGTKAATTKAAAATPATTTKTSTATAAKPAAATTKTTAKTATPAASVDPSGRLLAYLAKGKTLVVLFYGKGADDKAARKAVHQTALRDPRNVVSAYVPITKVGDYEAITSDVDILAAPTILVISTKGKATPLTGYVDAAVVRAAVAQARATAAATK
jgi:hypothetical protein